MTADQKLTARLETLSTEQLVETSLRMTLNTTTEAAIVANRADRILAQRMSEAEFAAHMDACDALLDAA